MAQKFGGKYSPGGAATAAEPSASPIRNKRVRRISTRARLLYLLPIPLLIGAIGAIGRGATMEMIGELGGFCALMFAAWLLDEGQKAENAYNERKIARPPAVPRKLIASALTGIGVFLAGWLGTDQTMIGALVFGLVASGAHVAAFGIDPMKKKGLEGLDEFETDRVARAIEKAEALVQETRNAANTIGERRIIERVEHLGDQAREMFRLVENDPRDLPRARRFMSVYLMGLRDATIKFADLYRRNKDTEDREKYELLLSDMEASFAAHRTVLLEDNRSDLDVEIEVLRERLQQDGLTVG